MLSEEQATDAIAGAAAEDAPFGCVHTRARTSAVARPAAAEFASARSSARSRASSVFASLCSAVLT
eukprot:6207651-Pleurochrysis_carterae.AAC.8